MQHQIASTLLDFVSQKNADKYEYESDFSDSMSDVSDMSDFPEYGRSLKDTVNATNLNKSNVDKNDDTYRNAMVLLEDFVREASNIIQDRNIVQRLKRLGENLIVLALDQSDAWKKAVKAELKQVGKSFTHRSLIHYIWRNAVSNVLSLAEASFTEDTYNKQWQSDGERSEFLTTVESASWTFAQYLRVIAKFTTESVSLTEETTNEKEKEWLEFLTTFKEKGRELGSHFSEQANELKPANKGKEEVYKVLDIFTESFLLAGMERGVDPKRRPTLNKFWSKLKDTVRKSGKITLPKRIIQVQK